MSQKSPLLVIFLVVFIDLVGFGIVIPILPYYAKQYGSTAFMLGWLMTSYSALQFVFAPIWGRVSDQIGRRPVLLYSMLGTALSLVALGAAGSLALLFAARILAGICGANISTATAYIADVTTPRNRAKGMGMIGAAFGLGFIFGPAIGGVLSRFGYGVPMYFAAALSGANILFAYFRLREPAINAKIRESHRHKRFDRKAIEAAMGSTGSRVAIVAFFLVTLAVTQMEVSFALFLQARHDLGAHSAGWLLAFLGTIMVIIQGGMIGRLSKRFGEQKLVIVGTVAMAVSLILLGQSQSIPTILTALALLAVGNGVVNPSLSSLASLGASAEHRGMTLGVYQSAGSLARVLGPPIAGFCFDKISIAMPFFTGSIFLAFAFVVAVKGARVWEKHHEPLNHIIAPDEA